MGDPNNPRLIRMKGLAKYLGFSKSYIHQKIAEGTFPPGHMISSGIRAWEVSEVNLWVDQRMARA